MIEHTCGHLSKRRPRNPDTRRFLETRACAECIVVELIEKLCRLELGERVKDAMLLSKKQSVWLNDTVRRELGRDIPFASHGDSIEIRGHRLVRMGRYFSANGNGNVVQVARVHTAEDEEARVAAINLNSARQLLERTGSDDANRAIRREVAVELVGEAAVAAIEKELS